MTMMAFFFTIPINKMMPITAMMLSSIRSRAAPAARPHPPRQRGEDRERVDEALVEDAEHDVDGHQRGRISSGWLASAAWKAWAVPVKLPRIPPGRPMRLASPRIAVTAWPRATSGARLKKIVMRGTGPGGSPASGARLVPNFVTAVSGPCCRRPRT